MKISSILAGAVLAATLFAANQTRTFTGVITCTMCSKDHKAMGVQPDAKCVRECIKHDKKSRYALLEGSNVWVLNDQQTPEKFAAQKVSIKGTLYEKTKILKVDSIEAAR